LPFSVRIVLVQAGDTASRTADIADTDVYCPDEQKKRDARKQRESHAD